MSTPNHPQTLSHTHTHTHSNMVTDTAIQRRIAEVLIEQCHWMFPGLPEPTTPSFSLTPTNSLSSSYVSDPCVCV